MRLGGRKLAMNSLALLANPIMALKQALAQKVDLDFVLREYK